MDPYVFGLLDPDLLSQFRITDPRIWIRKKYLRTTVLQHCLHVIIQCYCKSKILKVKQIIFYLPGGERTEAANIAPELILLL
jgi:hypothetical protein